MTAIPTIRRSAQPTRQPEPLIGTDAEFQRFLHLRRNPYPHPQRKRRWLLF